jgi:hypothetical protein
MLAKFQQNVQFLHVILRSSSRLWSTRSTLWSSVDVRGHPDFGLFSMLNLPSRKRWAQCEIVLQSTVSTPHTSINELWISVGVFPRNVSILMYARWPSLVTVHETRTAAISSLSRFHVHTRPGTKYTALASRSSPVQLLKWQDRWRHYLRSVTNVCISFEITLVDKTLSSASSVLFRTNLSAGNLWQVTLLQ